MTNFLPTEEVKNSDHFILDKLKEFGQPRKFSTGMVAKFFCFEFFGVNGTGCPINVSTLVS